MSHTCPAPGCVVTVPDHRLMCRVDWYKVPKDIRSWVWDAWQNGRGAGTEEHNHAIVAAVESLRSKDNGPEAGPRAGDEGASR